MRIEAGTYEGGKDWKVFHVPTCKQIKMCIWVDDVTNEFCYYTGETTPSGWVTRVEKARNITINPWTLTILIDPVEDPGEDIYDTVAIPLIDGQAALAM